MTPKPAPQPPNAAPGLPWCEMHGPYKGLNCPHCFKPQATPQAQGMPEEPTRLFWSTIGMKDDDGENMCLKFVDAKHYETLHAYAERLEAQLRQAREAERRVIEAARKILDFTSYVRDLPDDNPHKGAGNYLADALAAYDAISARREK